MFGVVGSLCSSSVLRAPDNGKGCWVRMVEAVSQVYRTVTFLSAYEVDFERMVGKEEQE